VRFADAKYRATLEGYDQNRTERLRREQYDRLVEDKNKASSEQVYLHLAQQFRAMEGYKDTVALADECARLYRELKERREEKEQAEQERQRIERERRAEQERVEQERRKEQERAERERQKIERERREEQERKEREDQERHRKQRLKRDKTVRGLSLALCVISIIMMAASGVNDIFKWIVVGYFSVLTLYGQIKYEALMERAYKFKNGDLIKSVLIQLGIILFIHIIVDVAVGKSEISSLFMAGAALIMMTSIFEIILTRPSSVQ
jgi:cation transport ATPase